MSAGRHREWGATPIYRHEWGLLGILIIAQMIISCTALVVLL